MRDYLHLFKPLPATREDINKRKRSTSAHQTDTGQFMDIIVLHHSAWSDCLTACVGGLPLLHSKLKTAEESKATAGAGRGVDEDLGLKLKAINNIAIIQ